MALAQRIAAVRAGISRAAERAGRDPGSVTLVAVSKTVDRATVDDAYRLGLRHFGENRVFDAVEKYAAPLPADAALHLIGQLQTNKVKAAAGLFRLIESVDRPSLVAALAKEGTRLGQSIPILLQVNVAGEDQKAGCPIPDADPLVDAILASPALALRGLMAIAPLVSDPEDLRPVFRGLRDLRDRLRDRHPEATLDILSMGMSNDYAVAIEEGATHVRVGRAVFDAR